jgi:hypothetical protein
VRNRPLARALESVLSDLVPGVTEVTCRPALDTPELRSLAPDWPSRVEEHDALVNDHSLRRLVERAGVTLIGYRPIRDLMRSATPVA